jgi:hypothetical protein
MGSRSAMEWCRHRHQPRASSFPFLKNCRASKLSEQIRTQRAGQPSYTECHEAAASGARATRSTWRSCPPLSPRPALLLLPDLERGRRIDAAILRTAMETAFGVSDATGAWDWGHDRSLNDLPDMSASPPTAIGLVWRRRRSSALQSTASTDGAAPTSGVGPEGTPRRQLRRLRDGTAM